MTIDPVDCAVRTVASVCEVDGSAGDRLAGENPLLGHGWLSLVEREWPEPLERRYLLVETAGRLVAAAACYVEDRAGSAESVDELVFGRLGGALSLRPALVCGFPWSVGAGCMFDPSLKPSKRTTLAGLLANIVTDDAERAGQTAVFLSVGGGELDLHAGLRERGYHGVLHEPIYTLDVRWPDFESYRRSLPSKNIRKNIRHMLNNCSKQGIVMATLNDPAAWAGELHRIVDRHFRRYGWRRFPYGLAWFGGLKQLVGEDAVITVARHHDRTVGVSVSMRRQGTRQMIIVCIDHAAEGGNLTHFNLAYNRGLEDCLVSGDRRYVIGPGQHVLRARRGFRPVESCLYCRPPDRAGRALLGGWLALLERWLQRKRRSVRA